MTTSKGTDIFNLSTSGYSLSILSGNVCNSEVSEVDNCSIKTKKKKKYKTDCYNLWVYCPKNLSLITFLFTLHGVMVCYNTVEKEVFNKAFVKF